MKALLISVRPQWVEKILNLIKKDEIRKGTAIGKAINKLIEEQGVAPTFIYCTKGKPTLKRLIAKSCGLGGYFDYEKLNGKVVARFNATVEDYVYGHKWSWEQGAPMWGADNSYEKILQDACLTDDELRAYVEDLCFSAIHINDLAIFIEPKEISEFKHIIRVIGCENSRGFDRKELRSLTRAPESWCYVEV